MGMKEEGITALLTANISKCVASYLSDNSDHFPSIVEEKLYIIMHQSCSKVDKLKDNDIDISFYYRTDSWQRKSKDPRRKIPYYSLWRSWNSEGLVS